MNEIQKNFIWDGKIPKIKHSTLICDYDEGGLKDIDIKSKIASFHLCWLKRLYTDNFHPWKNIPLKLIEKQYGYLIFFPNAQLNFRNNFPKFYHSIAENWSKIILDPFTAETAAAQQIWNNFHVKIDGLPAKKIFPFQLHVIDFFANNKLLDWPAFKSKFKLKNSDFFKWLQLKMAIPKKWITLIENSSSSLDKKDQHLIQLTRILPTEKLSSKILYLLLTRNIKKPPSSQATLMAKLNKHSINWKNIYTLGRRVTIENFCRIFHYKCTQNILYLNNRLFKWGKAEDNKCSFCNNFTEDTIHLFSQCSKTKNLWSSLENRINLQLPELTPESAYLGFHDLDDILINHIHLIFKIALYTRRADKTCSIEYILKKIYQIKEIEEKLSFFHPNSKEKIRLKWARVVSD